MQQPPGQFQKVSQRFHKEKYRLPKDIAWKLQYMLDFINKTAKPLKQLTEQQRDEVKDLEDMTPTALIYVFTSIVNSILSPNLYSSFYKNCKIKLEGLMPKWITVYISFDERAICFSNRKKIFRFVVEDLQCHPVSEIQLQLKYKGVRKSKIRFENQQAAKSVTAQINKIIQQHEKTKKKQSGEEQILSLKHYQQSLNRDYVIHAKQNDNIFMAHKTQPKIMFPFS